MRQAIISWAQMFHITESLGNDNKFSTYTEIIDTK